MDYVGIDHHRQYSHMTLMDEKRPKAILTSTRKNWLLGIGVAKMVTIGGPGIHLQKAPKLSNKHHFNR
jgi:hypothetical protein